MLRNKIILLSAALLITAVSCGKDSESSGTEKTTVSISYTEGTALQSEPEIPGVHIVDDIDEEALDEALKQAEAYEMPAFDPLAGIDITAEPLPEMGDIPDDWKRISDGRLSFCVPPDVELGERILTLRTAKNSDNTVKVMFMDGNDWKALNENGYEIDYEEYGLSQEQIDNIKAMEAEEASKAEKEAEELGYPGDEDITNEKTEKYMAAMGYEYDGSQLSKYKALLSMTSADRTDDNAEAFDYLATLKALSFGIVYPGVYGFEAGDTPVYLHVYPGLLEAYTDFKQPEKYRSVWVGAFVEPDLEYTALISANSHKEALMIASTIGIE